MDESSDTRGMGHLGRLHARRSDTQHGPDLLDGCITKAPCRGQTAGPSPVDRRKQRLKRSVAVDAHGVPLGTVAAPANRRDDGLLSATLDTLGSFDPLPVGSTV